MSLIFKMWSQADFRIRLVKDTLIILQKSESARWITSVYNVTAKKQPFDLENQYLIDDRKLILGYGSHHDTVWCFPSKLSSSAHKQQRLAPRNKRQVGALTKSQFATSPLLVKVYCKFLRQPIGLQRWNFIVFSSELDKGGQYKRLSELSSGKTLLVR